MRFHRVFLGLGSNIGNKVKYLQTCAEFLKLNKKINMINSSSVYESIPLNGENQKNYLNAAIEIETDLSPLELLEELKKIEIKIGRKERGKWAPREIDIDIILFDFLIYHSENLNIPHDRMLDRDFVLVPLIEIEKNLINPKNGYKLQYYLSKITKPYIINKLNIKLLENKGN